MARKKSILEFLPRRRIRVDIVSMFLVLIGCSSLIVTFYMDRNNYKGVLDISKTIVQQISLSMVEKVANITGRVELLAGLTKGIILKESDVSSSDIELKTYLLNALKYEPFVSSVYVGSPGGNFISANNLSLYLQPSYHFSPQKRLPEGAKYAYRTVDQTPTQENWEYKDTDLSNLDVEKSNEITYDPRIDHWFTQVMTWPRLYWMNTYSELFQEPALTLTIPVTDVQKNLLAIIGIDLSLTQLSNFISHEQIGLTGKAFILDEGGKVLLPTTFEPGSTDLALIRQAFDEYKLTQQPTYLLEKEMVQYLVSFVDYPLSPEVKWITATVVPFNDFFKTIVETQRKSVYVSLVIMIFFGIVVFLSSRHISVPIIQLANQVDNIQKLDFKEEDEPLASRIIEIEKLENSLSAMRKALRSFARYVPKEIVHTLVQQGQEITLGGIRRDITIMFSDMSHFTTLCESLTIEELISSLSAYFKVISEVIVQAEGTIDKYIGDSIMAFWNAPQPVSDHAYKACLTALRCLKICQTHKSEKFPWETRFGIHSGEVVVGNIGTAERMNYTVIGNVVNTAARFQISNKEYQTSIIISENVHEKIGARFLTRPLDFVAVKGKKNKLTLYELVGSLEEADEKIRATPEQIEFCREFSIAYYLFHEGKLKEAKAQFLTLAQKYPTDRPTQIYVERLTNIT